MENIEQNILKKCGWDDKKLEFLGTLVYNIKNSDGTPIADVVSNRNKEQIIIDWFVPTKESDNSTKISVAYSLITKQIMKDKTDPEIKTEQDLTAFLNTIENTIKNSTGTFFPKSKIDLTNKPSLK